MNYPEHSSAAIQTTAAHLQETAEQRRQEADEALAPSYAHLLLEQAEILEHMANKLVMGRET
jgi:hypothetical protein